MSDLINYLEEKKNYSPDVHVYHQEDGYEVSATFQNGKLIHCIKTEECVEQTLKVQLLSENAKLPTRANKTDAGLDLYAAESVMIRPGETVKIKTDIAMEICEGYYGHINDRSSMGSKGLKVMGGICDSAYRGNILVCLCNTSNGPESDSYIVSKGDKIAQMVILSHESWDIQEVNELSQTERGDGGFGSSGV